MIFRGIVYVKLIFNITVNIFVEIFNFNLIHQAVSVCEEELGRRLCTISILLLDVVLVESYISLADIEDAHSTIYWLIEHQLGSLHVDCNEAFNKILSNV